MLHFLFRHPPQAGIVHPNAPPGGSFLPTSVGRADAPRTIQAAITVQFRHRASCSPTRDRSPSPRIPAELPLLGHGVSGARSEAPARAHAGGTHWATCWPWQLGAVLTVTGCGKNTSKSLPSRGAVREPQSDLSHHGTL